LRSGVRASFPAPDCQRENAQQRFSLFDFQRTRIAHKFAKRIWNSPRATLAGWQSGYAAACKAVYAGSIPTPASIKIKKLKECRRIALGQSGTTLRARLSSRGRWFTGLSLIIACNARAAEKRNPRYPLHREYAGGIEIVRLAICTLS
jgi:hypothetical protein